MTENLAEQDARHVLGTIERLGIDWVRESVEFDHHLKNGLNNEIINQSEVDTAQRTCESNCK